MNIGLAVATFKNNEIESNLGTIFNYMEIAKEKKVDLLVFGESFLQGFNALTWNPNKDKTICLDKHDQKILHLRNMCKKLEVALGIGYLEKENEDFYSSYLVIDKDGNELANYRRMSKGWRSHGSDDQFYKEGKTLPSFKFLNRSFTVGLCGDFWANDIVELIPKKSDVVLWPVFIHWENAEWEKIELNEYVKQAAKLGTNVFLVNSLCNDENSLAYGGAFSVIKGNLSDVLRMEAEGILCCNV